MTDQKETKSKSLELKVFVIAEESIDTSKLVVKLTRASADAYIASNPGSKIVKLYADKRI